MSSWQEPLPPGRSLSDTTWSPSCPHPRSGLSYELCQRFDEFMTERRRRLPAHLLTIGEPPRLLLISVSTISWTAELSGSDHKKKSPAQNTGRSECEGVVAESDYQHTHWGPTHRVTSEGSERWGFVWTWRKPECCCCKLKNRWRFLLQSHRSCALEESEGGQRWRWPS